MRLKDISETTTDVYNIALSSITVDPNFNVRFETPELREHIGALRDSIVASGFLRSRPLTVRMAADGGMAVVTDGHCRLAAARLAVEAGAEIRTLPCVAEGRGVGAADRDLMLLTANNGLPLSPLEQAEVVRRLLSYGWTENEIARRIGRSRQHVCNLLDLAEAPEAVRACVVSGEVSATAAVALMKREGAAAPAILERAVVKAREGGKNGVKPKDIGVSRTAPAPVPPTIDVAPPTLADAARAVCDLARGAVLPAELRAAIDALWVLL